MLHGFFLRYEFIPISIEIGDYQDVYEAVVVGIALVDQNDMKERARPIEENGLARLSHLNVGSKSFQFFYHDGTAYATGPAKFVSDAADSTG
jgi:hypothetical protein